MRVYIHDAKTGGKIESICRGLQVKILTEEEVSQRTELPENVDFFLDEVDALIMDVTKPNNQIHFIVAQALLTQKPTLCVYGKNQGPGELLGYIRKQPSPRPIKTYGYTTRTLQEGVERFLINHNPTIYDIDDDPLIKFTMRFSPRLDRYMEWYAGQNGISKARAVRSLLEKYMKKDDRYIDELYTE